MPIDFKTVGSARLLQLADVKAAIVEKLKWMLVGSGPEPRPVEDQRLMLAWIECAYDSLCSDGDDVDASLLCGLWDGTFEFGVDDGEVRFRLTEKGHEKAKNALMNSPEMRHFYQSLNRGSAVDEPKKVQ